MKASTLSIIGCLIISLIALCRSDCPYKFQGFEGHTACLAKSSNYISGGVSDKDKQDILDVHNKHRAAVTPPACAMLKLYWNDELAFIAQKWADNCEFKHDPTMKRYIPGSYTLGQNLGSGFSSWTALIDAWQKEVKDFTFNGTNVLAKVGHYTQVVWDTSTLIGCGYAKCKNLQLHVCVYAPSGNSGQIKRPYKSCTKVTPLKDCKGKVCKNGGFFKEGTCDCACNKVPHIYGAECNINCTMKDRNNVCENGYKPAGCAYSNVPGECPWMCKVCPYISEAELKTSATTTPTPTPTPTTTTVIKTRPTFTPDFSGSYKYSATSPLVLTVLFLSLMI